MKISFNIIANGIVDNDGLSGGDEIFINLAKYLIKKGIEVNIFTWKPGKSMCQKCHLVGANYRLMRAEKYASLPFGLFYLMRTYLGMKEVDKFIKNQKEEKKYIIYSASDFYPDFFPAIYFKNKVKNSVWYGSFYLFAPHPFKGYRGFFKKSFRIPVLRELAYWLSQSLVAYLIPRKADYLCVTSEPDLKRFANKGFDSNKILVVKGGIDYKSLERYQKETRKIFDAIYVGRFHPQKGVIEMIDIWSKVVSKKQNAKLAIIGTGPLKEKMVEEVNKFGLNNNIRMFGTLIGEKRNELLGHSKIILHPAVYDSGGMAAALGLACGLPGVSFKLPVFSSYYPKGFIKAEIMDNLDFAEKICRLLDNPAIYRRMRLEAIQEARSWDWEKRFDKLFTKITV